MGCLLVPDELLQILLQRPRVIYRPGSHDEGLEHLAAELVGTPDDCDLATWGWPARADSTSKGPMRYPAMMMMSSSRAEK
jgi:hypothetical protein